MWRRAYILTMKVISYQDNTQVITMDLHLSLKIRYPPRNYDTTQAEKKVLSREVSELFMSSHLALILLNPFQYVLLLLWQQHPQLSQHWKGTAAQASRILCFSRLKIDQNGPQRAAPRCGSHPVLALHGHNPSVPTFCTKLPCPTFKCS